MTFPLPPARPLIVPPLVEVRSDSPPHFPRPGTLLTCQGSPLKPQDTKGKTSAPVVQGFAQWFARPARTNGARWPKHQFVLPATPGGDPACRTPSSRYIVPSKI